MKVNGTETTANGEASTPSCKDQSNRHPERNKWNGWLERRIAKHREKYGETMNSPYQQLDGHSQSTPGAGLLADAVDNTDVNSQMVGQMPLLRTYLLLPKYRQRTMAHTIGLLRYT